ncbi:hypothetical protein [Thalassomonas sp. M1454]|uniref:hypothetical protein n=1 Tax=Thalassomonas sp. M1454 TaxID=2594477 RepID=UPI00117DED51|nr:hypothetical protein [Thalassomonas sp. M1454]TRX55092.1 hypothetical protein FNN08_10875 [Thalassomonas sp. M1454]
MKIQSITVNLFTLFALLFIPVNASVAMVDADVQKCAKLSDDKQRLACFDAWFSANNLTTSTSDNSAPEVAITTAESSPLITEPILPEPAAVTVQAPDPAKELENNFGNEHKKTQAEIDTDHFIFTIEKASKNPHGKWTLTFTNGQKWSTISSGRIKLKSGQQVKISRGMFNSFSLTTENSNRSVKVKRIN